MKIILGNDHAGFALKKAIVEFLKEQHIAVDDAGSYSDEPVDYPDIGYPVAKSVADGRYDYGILLCGSGIGMSVVANKVPGIRAALCMTPEQGELSKTHNNANIIVLAARLIDEQTAIEIVRRWLNSNFEGGRHSRRIQKIHTMMKLYQ